MSDPYRTAWPAPKTHDVFDVSCRRCSTHGLFYVYWPMVAPDPGPLCRTCFIEWKGPHTRYAISGVGGFFTIPHEWKEHVHFYPRRDYPKIKADGPMPTYSPWVPEGEGEGDGTLESI